MEVVLILLLDHKILKLNATEHLEHAFGANG
jgi:hypothetical protein